MSWAGWILFVLVCVWSVTSEMFSQKKRLHLRSYAILLLLNDDIREDHKGKMADWIRGTDARNALDLHQRADAVLENMADDFAVSGDSLLAATTLLWHSEAATKLRSRAGTHDKLGTE